MVKVLGTLFKLWLKDEIKGKYTVIIHINLQKNKIQKIIIPKF